MDVYVFIIVFVLLAVLSGILGYIVRIKQYEGSLKKTEALAKEIIENAQTEAEKLKKETIAEGKLEIQNLKNEADTEIKSRKQVVEELEKKINSREEALDRRSSNLDRREEILDSKELKLDDKRVELEALGSKAEELVAAQEAKLIEISNLTYDEARNIIMTKVKDDMSVEIATYIKDEEEKAKSEIHNRAKNMLALAIQKYASETTSEKTVSVVDLPSDEMKGRIIGREGRNIRAIESLTGVDLIIDDTPDAVVLSGFDPVRREIARKALQSLVSDGRIHPSRIEEVVERARAEVDTYIRECGEEAVFTANIGRVHPDLIKLLGRLNYRTSYGQNVLKHSIETAYLAGKLAAELGENETIARRAGLLHDIGKAVDHEVEGSHVEIGVSIANRYRECKEVVDAIASHHGDKEPECIISVLVAAADALSAARPGARSESLDNYVKRLEQLEKIGDSVAGVEKSFAVQAGREIRVMVKPQEIDDVSTFAVARKIKEEIENNLSYPGTVKVTVIREIRATDVAK